MKIDPDQFAAAYLAGKMNKVDSINAAGALKFYLQAIDAAEAFNSKLDALDPRQLESNLEIFNKLKI